MFDVDSVKSLNDLELLAFDYINREPGKVQEMTIRELAETIHTSTTTIMRLSTKLGFRGWAELKYYLKSKALEQVKADKEFENKLSLDLFWKQLASPDMQKKINQAAEVIANSKYVVFLGLGTSDALARYGARYFTSLGISSFTFGDIFRPVAGKEFSGSTAVVLSVSGETPEVLEKTMEIQRSGGFLTSITNNANSTLSKMADISFFYNVVNEYARVEKDIKLTTQLPVLAMIELLAHRAHQAAGDSSIL